MGEEDGASCIECIFETNSPCNGNVVDAIGDWRWAIAVRCYNWLSSKIREEAYETSQGVDEHLCSESRAGLNSQAGDKMH